MTTKNQNAVVQQAIDSDGMRIAKMDKEMDQYN